MKVVSRPVRLEVPISTFGALLVSISFNAVPSLFPSFTVSTEHEVVLTIAHFVKAVKHRQYVPLYLWDVIERVIVPQLFRGYGVLYFSFTEAM
jgi:hypothetical protein